MNKTHTKKPGGASHASLLYVLRAKKMSARIPRILGNGQKIIEYELNEVNNKILISSCAIPISANKLFCSGKKE